MRRGAGLGDALSAWEKGRKEDERSGSVFEDQDRDWKAIFLSG